jgi:MSHA pilin protein MshC
MHKQYGFTLVELVITIVIVGILAAVVGPRFFSAQSFQERGYFDEVAAALRYAQKLSIATQCPVQVNINAGGYSLFFPNDTDGIPATCNNSPAVYGGNPVRALAGQGNFAKAAPSGVNISNFVVAFDSLGRPTNSGDITIGGRTLTIEADSGYVR